MTGIKFFGLDRQYHNDAEVYNNIFQDIYSTGKLLGGHHTRTFKTALKNYTKRECVNLVGSGTDALYFIACSTKIKTAICTNYSFAATSSALKRATVNITYCDVDEYGLLDLDKLSEILYLTSVDAVVYVNLFGNPIHYNRLLDLSKKHNFIIIEDGAQSLGASSDGIMSGAMGHYSALSFDPTKNLNCAGVGGAILCNDLETSQKIEKMHKNNANHSAGYNSQLSELDAAFLTYRLNKKFNDWQQRRKQIAEFYINELKTFVKPLVIQNWFGQSSYHKFVIYTNQRNNLKSYLESKNIETRIHYNCPLDIDSNSSDKTIVTQAIDLSNNCLSLPIYPELLDTEIELICDSVKKFFAELPII